MMAGGLTFRIGRLAASEAFAALGLMGNPLLATGSRAVAWAAALACEVSAFRGVNQLLSPVALSPEQSWLNPQSWLASCADFFALKTMGRWGAGNLAMSHLAQDAAVVAGRNAGAALGLSEKSNESLSQQMLHAEAMIWQMAAGMKLAGVLSGHHLNRWEQSLERGTVLRNLEVSGLRGESVASLHPRMAAGDGAFRDVAVDFARNLLVEGAVRASFFLRSMRCRSIEEIIASLPNTAEGLRDRRFLEVFKNENVRIQEIALGDRKNLERAWGKIPQSVEAFLRRHPEARHLKIWRFHGVENLESPEAQKAFSMYGVLALATEIRLGFGGNTLFKASGIVPVPSLDVLPDAFYLDAIEHQFPENPFKAVRVKEEIDGVAVRLMRRNNSYPLYDGLEPIHIHGGMTVAKAARAHDLAHILMLAGYSRDYVDDLMDFYDALQDYRRENNLPTHQNIDAEIYEGGIDNFLNNQGRENYFGALTRIPEVEAFAKKDFADAGFSSDADFINEFSNYLSRYFPSTHPRHGIIMRAWARLSFPSSARS